MATDNPSRVCNLSLLRRSSLSLPTHTHTHFSLSHSHVPCQVFIFSTRQCYMEYETTTHTHTHTHMLLGNVNDCVTKSAMNMLNTIAPCAAVVSNSELLCVPVCMCVCVLFGCAEQPRTGTHMWVQSAS